ncbi:acyl-CoA dehydrogenase family protein [Alkalihalobacillus macyae]|uniref:acyl-CoA dehydrogenase family protein n=1 Tax=Guptibacillus hwajinpoensis TaxID=208199 RepID=UPI00273BD62A|nr:acyl-CoA dehydrogenase family protein [Alkalihalobacillus macyae]MDP4553568.1 acyl-CoA dehydrogenase family protein [Alkalihalobacillus macyae]
MPFAIEKQPNLEEDLAELVERFKTRAAKYDEEERFPYENFEDLKEKNFISLTVPKEYGGYGLNLNEFLKVQEQLASGDGATALSLGWQLGVILEIAESRAWEEEVFSKVCSLIVNEKALLNLAQTEKATGSPSRGGTPLTTATKTPHGWVINGRKSFTSMAVALDYSIVTADVDQTGKKGFVLIDHKLEGVQVEETWDSISMKGTKSDDLVLNDVLVKPEDLLVIEEKQTSLPKGWYLQIPAVYLGIATSAMDYTVEFASTFSPSTLPGPIKDVSEVRRKIGEMQLELFNAREVLYSVAQRWSENPDERQQMGADLAAVKHIVTNSANRVVDLAMRVVGARSLSASNPLQRHFRNVRAGLHNPPTDDAIVYSLADSVFKD